MHLVKMAFWENGTMEIDLTHLAFGALGGLLGTCMGCLIGILFACRDRRSIERLDARTRPNLLWRA